MELDFGDIWDLRWNPAVDGRDADMVLQLMGRANYDDIVPFISDDRRQGTINGGELGCVLSHLTAIKRAYLEGDEIAMVVEDDITPLLMLVHVGWLCATASKAISPFLRLPFHVPVHSSLLWIGQVWISLRMLPRHQSCVD